LGLFFQTPFRSTQHSILNDCCCDPEFPEDFEIGCEQIKLVFFFEKKEKKPV